jgi:hypothetical protein
MRPMTSKERILIEAFLDFNKRDLRKQVKDYKEFLDVLILLQDHLVKSGIKVPNHIAHIDTLISKIIFHSNTIYHLLNGIDLEIKPEKVKTKILDIPSLYVLLRSQLENFLIFDFIYCQSKSEEETIFRYNNWLYAGYLTRRDIPAESESAKKMKESDLKEIERLKIELQNSKFFKTLSRDQQKTLINKGNDRVFHSWLTIMLAAGFGERTSGSLYKLITAYAHTTSVSIFNFTELKAGYSENNDMANLIVSLSKVILSKFIVRFKQKVKVVEFKYNMLNPDLIATIEFYSSMLEKKSRFTVH